MQKYFTLWLASSSNVGTGLEVGRMNCKLLEIQQYDDETRPPMMMMMTLFEFQSRQIRSTRNEHGDNRRSWIRTLLQSSADTDEKRRTMAWPSYDK